MIENNIVNTNNSEPKNISILSNKLYTSKITQIKELPLSNWNKTAPNIDH